MYALTQRGDTQGRVLVMRRGNNHGVHQPGANQLLAISKDFERLVLLQLARDGVGDRHQFGAIDFAGGQIAMMVLADIAHPDDSQTHVGHERECRGRGGNFQPRLLPGFGAGASGQDPHPGPLPSDGRGRTP